MNLEFDLVEQFQRRIAKSDKESLSQLIMHFFQVQCGEFIEGVRSTEVNVPELRHRSHRSNVPNHQLPTDSGCTDLGDRPALPFVGSYTRDTVLVHSEQLGFSLRAPASTTGARTTPRICVLERVKGRVVQPPGSNRTKPGRSESGFRSGRVVETSDEPLSTFVSREDIRLAMVTSSDDGVLGGPNEEEERSS